MPFSILDELESMRKQFDDLASRKVATEECEATIQLERIHQLRKAGSEGIGAEIGEVRLLAHRTHQRFIGQPDRDDSQSSQNTTK